MLRADDLGAERPGLVHARDAGVVHERAQRPAFLLEDVPHLDHRRRKLLWIGDIQKDGAHDARRVESIGVQLLAHRAYHQVALLGQVLGERFTQPAADAGHKDCRLVRWRHGKAALQEACAPGCECQA